MIRFGKWMHQDTAQQAKNYSRSALRINSKEGIAPESEPQDAQAATGTAVRVGSFETRDPGVHEQAAVPWDVVMSPHSREFGSFNTYLATPKVTLYHEGFSGMVHIEGLAPPTTLGFALLVKGFYNSTWWKAPLHESGIPFMMRGGPDVEFSAAHENIIALIDLELLRSAWPDELVEQVGALLMENMKQEVV